MNGFIVREGRDKQSKWSEIGSIYCECEKIEEGETHHMAHGDSVN